MVDRMAPCPCGLAEGRAACQDLMNDVALRVRALAWTGSMPTWRLMHDVYCIQHEEEYCNRYVGLAAHLGGVCWGLEHGGREKGYRALQKFIETKPWGEAPYPPAPGIPKDRGAVTVASLKEADDPERLAAGVDRWARSAWVAYAALQPLAREWVRAAMENLK